MELAVCMPLLALLIFGSIQACDLIYLKHSLTAAAYEGSLELNKANATNADVEARITQVLDSRGVTDTSSALAPSGVQVDQVPHGTTITVTVTADVAPNLMLSGFFFCPPQLSGEVASVR